MWFWCFVRFEAQHCQSTDIRILSPLCHCINFIPLHFSFHVGMTQHSGHLVNPTRNLIINMKSVLHSSPQETWLIGKKMTVMSLKVTSAKSKVCSLGNGSVKLASSSCQS